MKKILVTEKKINLEKLPRYDFTAVDEPSGDVVGYIAGTEIIDKKLLDTLPELKVISRFGAGTDNIDKEEIEKRGIVLCTTKSHSIAVAEHTICLILSVLRIMGENTKRWNPLVGMNLFGKSVGIIGYGNVGKRVHKILNVFDTDVSIYDIEYKNSDKIEDVIMKSDIITLHVPLNSKTHHLIGEKELKMMKDNVIIINTSRGKVIDENALMKYRKKTYGVGFDTMSTEPYNGDLYREFNFIITPHIASYTIETLKMMEKETIDNLFLSLEELDG